MAQQTSVDEIILAINEQMDILEMDYNNDVEWSMLVMHGCLKGLLFKCKKAKAIEKEQITDAYIMGMEFIPVDPSRYQQDAEQYYNETYSNGKKD